MSNTKLKKRQLEESQEHHEKNGARTPKTEQTLLLKTDPSSETGKGCPGEEAT